MINDAVIDYYILRRDAAVTTGFVLAGLHAYSIVADIEGATADYYVLAGLYVHAVTVLAVPGVADIEVTQDEVLAAHRVEVPRRAVLKGHALEEDILASYEMEHYRTEERFDYLPEAVIFDDGHVLVEAISLRQDRCAIRIPDIVLGHYAAFLLEVFLPLTRSHLGFLKRTPPVAVAVEGSKAGDGDVLCVARIERRCAALGRDAFEPLVVDLIEVEIVAEDDERVLLGEETDVGLEGNRSGGVDTFGDDDRSAAGCRTLVDGFLDGLGSQSDTGVVGSVVEDVKRAVRERRHRHFRHLKGSQFGQGIDVLFAGCLVL